MPSNRIAILNNLRTTLQGIVAGTVPDPPPGYYDPPPTQEFETSVQVVDNFMSLWDEVSTQNPATARPRISIAPGPESIQWHPTRHATVKFRVSLWCHITGSTDDSMRTTVDALLDDVIYALNIDTRRGGYATETTVLATETDELDINRADSITLRIDLEIKYTRTMNKN